MFVLGLVALYSASNENSNRLTNKLTFIVFGFHELDVVHCKYQTTTVDVVRRADVCRWSVFIAWGGAIW